MFVINCGVVNDELYTYLILVYINMFELTQMNKHCLHSFNIPFHEFFSQFTTNSLVKYDFGKFQSSFLKLQKFS